MFNHGSAGTYERLIRKARGAGMSTVFMAINSGSSQLAHKLGSLASGMVFAQVVPNPFSRATQLARDYQDSFRKAWPDKVFSYGSLEGWLTARALVAALSAAGPVWLHVGAETDAEAIVYLRFLDPHGRLILERRLSIAEGEVAVNDVAAYGLDGRYTLELVSSRRIEATLRRPLDVGTKRSKPDDTP